MKLCLMHGERTLSPSVWANTLLRNGPIGTGDVWSSDAIANGIQIDLSRIEWADFATAAQVVLFVHKAATANIAVQIDLPDSSDAFLQGQYSDSDSQRLAEESRRGRTDTAAFFKRFEFVSAILQQPEAVSWLCPAILERGRPYVGEVTYDMNRSRSHIVPMMWLDFSQPTALSGFAKFFAGVFSQHEFGLSRTHAEALAHAIAFELVENTFVHSGGSKLALICAWGHPSTASFTSKTSSSFEEPFVQSMKESSEGLLEVFVGDAGRGIIPTLSDAYLQRGEISATRKRKKNPPPGAVIDWAFDRWSTSLSGKHRPGVRGLYRMDRLAARYGGLLTVVSHRTIRVRSHGNLEGTQVVGTSQLRPYFPGSSIRMRLQVGTNKRPATKLFRRPPAQADVSLEPEVSVVGIGPPTDAGLSRADRNAVTSVVTNLPSTPSRTVVIAISPGTYSKLGAESAMTFFASISAPHALVIVGLPGSSEQIRSVADSMAASTLGLPRSRTRQTRTIDPIFVLTLDGESFWVASDEVVKEFLDTRTRVLSNPDEPVQQFASASVSDRTLAQSLKGRLLPYSNLAMRLSPEAKQQIRQSFPFRELGLERFSSSVSSSLSMLLTSSPDLSTRQFVDYVKHGRYLTPTLQQVRLWIECDRLFSHGSIPGGKNGIVRALGTCSLLSLDSLGSCDVVLSEKALKPGLGILLSQMLGVEHRIAKDVSSADVLAVDRHKKPERFLVYADVVSSGETIRALTKWALRLHCEVVAIACVLDLRVNPAVDIDVWGTKIPVISLVQLPSATVVDHKLQLMTIRPSGGIEQAPDAPSSRADELFEVLDNNVGFKMQHTARPSGRHLTFTLDPIRLLREDRVRTAVVLQIRAWLASNFMANKSTGRIRLVGCTLDNNATTAGWFELVKETLLALSDDFDVDVIQAQRIDGNGELLLTPAGDSNIFRDSHVVVLDWGAITGESVIQLTRRAIVAGARSALGFVLLSEMTDNEQLFLASVSELSVEDIEPRADLWSPQNTTVRRAPVAFRWLAHCNFGHYPESKCPVCEQRAEISETSPHNAYLRAFRRAELLRLDPTLEFGAPTIASSRRGQAPDNYAVKASSVNEFRRLMLDSSSSTFARSTLKVKLEEASNDLTESYSVVSLLAFEPQWLKRPPLSYGSCRQLVAAICVAIVGDRARAEEMRCIAIRVLRRSSKDRFIREFANLFARCASVDRLCQTLLFSAYTILHRGYIERLEVFTLLHKALQDVLKTIDNADGSRGAHSARPAVEEMLNACLFLLEREKYRSSPLTYALARLKDRFKENYPHSLTGQALADMRGTAERKIIRDFMRPADMVIPNPDDTRSAERWLERSAERWQRCLGYLEARLMPILITLQPLLRVTMLESFYAEYAQRIATLVTHYGLVGMPKRLPLTNAFERLSVGLRLSDLRTAENSALWELADKELQWHIETFLEPIGASRICGLFADTPSDIWKVFRVLVSDANFKASPRTVLLTPANETEYASSSAEVFCSRAILAQLFAVAFDNMSKYVNPSLQDGRVQYRATTSEAGNFLTFLLENDNTTIAESAQENRLHALELMAADVANFGGELTHGRCELVGGGWQPTFFLKLRLFKWTENV